MEIDMGKFNELIGRVNTLECENVLLKLEISNLRYNQELELLKDIKQLTEEILLNRSKLAQIHVEIEQNDKEVKKLMENLKLDGLFDENGELIK